MLLFFSLRGYKETLEIIEALNLALTQVIIITSHYKGVYSLSVNIYLGH